MTIPASSSDSPAEGGPISLRDCDRFELLSAYFDGEVTPAERRQVEVWLDTDPQTKELYRRLRCLRSGLQGLPVHHPLPCSSAFMQRLWGKLQHQRWQRWSLLGGGAIAALFLGTVLFPEPQWSVQQSLRASQSLPQGQSLQPTPGSLTLALNRPVVPIPKTATALKKRNAPETQP